MVNLKNPFPGINPQLNSLLQTRGTDEQPSLWPSFHSQYISLMTLALNDSLPVNYIAMDEHSLQSRGENHQGDLVISRPKPDVTVFQSQPGIALAEKTVPAPTWQAALEDTIDPEDRMKAVIIRKLDEQSVIGTPVLRIELLSPSNKRDGSHYAAYRTRRIEALHSHVPLIEVDYLHESLSPIIGWPAYPQDENSLPYYIAIHDNRSRREEAITQVYGFQVGQKIPELLIPLDGENHHWFDFDAPYQQVYERGRWGQIIQPRKGVLRLETYAPQDQERIQATMGQPPA